MIVNSRSVSTRSSSASALDLPSTASPMAAATSSGDSSVLSDFATLMQQLGDMQQTDPEKFKKVAAEIVQKMKDSASIATGFRAEFLNDIARRFGKASQTGDLSDLQPPGGSSHRPGHHRVHPYAAQQGTDASAAPPLGVDIAQIIQASIDDVG